MSLGGELEPTCGSLNIASKVHVLFLDTFLSTPTSSKT
jgi:hypothetical protein